MVKSKWIIQRLYAVWMCRLDKKIKEEVFDCLERMFSCMLVQDKRHGGVEYCIHKTAKIFKMDQKCRFSPRNKGYKERFLDEQVSMASGEGEVCLDIITTLDDQQIRAAFIFYLEQQAKNISINKLFANFYTLLERCCDLWVAQELECLSEKDMDKKSVIYEKYKSKPLWENGHVQQTVKNKELVRPEQL